MAFKVEIADSAKGELDEIVKKSVLKRLLCAHFPNGMPKSNI